MDADAAHFMNVARCFARGQGFSNPAAWPAWMKPERLPMPETFKEPAYPWAIAQLTPIAGGDFRAGLALSFAAGLLVPLLTWRLARQLDPDPTVALLAGLMAAASPLLIAQSARVMVESVFAAAFTMLWAMLAARPGPGARGLAADLGTGIVLGIAFMLRAQTLLAAPAIAILLLRNSGAAALRRAAVVGAAAIATASPFLLRNLRLFGSPLHSDIAAFGLLPYLDHLTLQGSLDRPPGALGFALAHPVQVAAHAASSAVRFAVRTLPKDILGNPVWTIPLAAGALLSLARWREWLFVYVQLGLTLGFIFAVNWDARYFASGVPLWCVLAAPGALWIARSLADARLGPLRGRELLIGALGALVLLQTAAARREVAEQPIFENAAARSESRFLTEHLAPDEAVMALTTSYYSYWADRPAVFVMFADAPRFLAETRRLKVRYAAFPISRLREIASHFPDRRLPEILVPDHADSARDVTVFRVTGETVRNAPGE